MNAETTLFGLLGFLLVLILLLVIISAVPSISSGGSVNSSRRGIIQVSIASVVAAIMGPAVMDAFVDGKTQIADVLRIPSGETVAVASRTVSYTAVEWEQTGQLEWGEWDSFTLSDEQ